MQVSVVIPVYNGEGTLGTALDSVMVQEVPLEILVVDDGSTDGTADLVKSYCNRYPQIRYERNIKNLGAAKSRARAVEKARGEFVAFLDSDDWWTEGKLAAQLDVLRKTGCVLCCTARELMTPQGELTGRVIGVKDRITYRDLLRHNSINCSSVVIRRDAIREFPMEHEDSHEDYITWLKVLRKYGDAVGINEPMLKYRLSNSGKSGNKLKSAGMTFKVYRYMGFGWGRSAVCFVSYAVHGVWKYLKSYIDCKHVR